MVTQCTGDMSGGSSRPQNGNGIRKYLSPPAPPVQPCARRRRIIDSDSSEDHPPAQIPRSEQSPLAHLPAAAAQLPPLAEASAAAARPETPIMISDSEDSMYVPVRWEQQPASSPREIPGIADTTTASNRRAESTPSRASRLQPAPSPRAIPANAQTRTTPQRRAATSPPRTSSQRRTATSRQLELAARICDCEAEEVSEEGSSSAPDESDANAAELYRSAILGVRNRPNAMRQLRTDTVPCATCAKFMEFLRCFL